MPVYRHRISNCSTLSNEKPESSSCRSQVLTHKQLAYEKVAVSTDLLISCLPPKLLNTLLCCSFGKQRGAQGRQAASPPTGTRCLQGAPWPALPQRQGSSCSSVTLLERRRLGAAADGCFVWNVDKADELLLIFTHIDPSSHMREFLLGVHVQEDNTYNGASQTLFFKHPQGQMTILFPTTDPHGCCAVTRCQPALEGLDAMLADLNRTNSFKTFVRHVRRHFRKLVN